MGEHTGHTGEIEARVREIQQQKRTAIRWGIGRHTAEMALGALDRPRRHAKSSKNRRRKRRKRLL